MAETSTRPSPEAITIGQVIGSSATPTPMATIDSPSATMVISPCRSEKWSGAGSRQPAAPPSAVPT